MSPRVYWLNEFENKCEDTGRNRARQVGAMHAAAIRQFIEKAFRPSDTRAGMAEALGDVSDDAVTKPVVCESLLLLGCAHGPCSASRTIAETLGAGTWS
jgi:hypothetical protein